MTDPACGPNGFRKEKPADRISGFKKGAKVTVKLEAPHEIGGYSVWAPGGVEAKKKNDQVLYISFTYNGKNIQGQVTGTDISNGRFKVSVIKNSAPKAKKKTTKSTKAASAKKKSASKKSTSGKKTPAAKETLIQTSETIITSETKDGKVLAAAIDESAETTPAETEDASDVALAHDDSGKSQRSFAWLWIVFLSVIALLVILRIKKLRDEGKYGKDLVLDFFPVVGDLVYAYSGSGKKYAPIASDAQHGYNYNPAAGKKEIKQIEEEEEKAERMDELMTHAPIKRPKEFSVNHAAIFAPLAAQTEQETGSEAEDSSETSLPQSDNKKTDSPFKPAEGLTRPEALDPNKVFKTEVSHTTDEIMTSAFKPAAGSHTTEKIVTSAFKPAAGSRPADKIVTSAVKPTSKFTPQRGGASATHSADSEAIKWARERAEAAREQQAMRAAMRTGKTSAEARGETKPGQSNQVSRPSAFGTARPAPAATATDKKFNPMVAPVRTKSAPTNSNQLGNMLSGKSNNGAARTPVWASRGTAGINPFKHSDEAEADVAEETNVATSSYGTAVRSDAILEENVHVRDTRYKPAKGSILEGQRPAISDPAANVAPTATQPVFGFKPINPQ